MKPTDVAMQDLKQKLHRIHTANQKNGLYNDRVTVMLTTLFPAPRPDSAWGWVRRFIESILVSSTKIERPFAFSLGQPNYWLVMLETGQLAWRRPSHTAYAVVNLHALSPDEFRQIAAEIVRWWIIYQRPIQSTRDYRPEAR